MIKQNSFILIWMESLIVYNRMTGKCNIAIDNLNLRIDNGEFVTISGIYGTDKISFINTLSCLDRPDDGKYMHNYIDTTTVERYKLDNIRSGIGFLFKSLNIIEDLTVYQNIELPILISGESEKSHIKTVAERLGLSSSLHIKVKELSDLERHKVALARALAVNPILIIADEPADNLNQQDQSAVLDIMQEINSTGTAIICFSDKQQLIERSNRHIILENGRIKSDNIGVNYNHKEGAV